MDKSRLLIERDISNRETRLALLDLATGQATELPWTREPARDEESRFTTDGSGILSITNHKSDLRRLVEIDIATGRRTPPTPHLEGGVRAFDERAWCGLMG